MGICIFCNTSIDGKAPIEHIWPESFGATTLFAPNGTVCKSCNNYFSREVERLALDSFPFKFIRSFFGIPTKKNKVSISKTAIGDMYGQPGGRFIHLNSDEINNKAKSGEIETIQLTISLKCEHPNAVCRLLLKMALGLIAKKNLNEAYSDKYALAKQFARFPKRGSQWSFAIYYGAEILFDSLIKGLQSSKELNTGLSIVEYEEGNFFIMEILGVRIITPLSDNISISDFSQPDLHIYSVMI